ncbi:hypothetical protein MAR_036996 [Mya arenaria]|uniref:Uncharacterized protein n=1 Tax=Mya arenaria TaxID=6604 RepID=A0ABY7FNZ3_MYAAR|nr:hypothetical protein MAR_036996 [Mya arenaria]
MSQSQFLEISIQPKGKQLVRTRYDNMLVVFITMNVPTQSVHFAVILFKLIGLISYKMCVSLHSLVLLAVNAGRIYSPLYRLGDYRDYQPGNTYCSLVVQDNEHGGIDSCHSLGADLSFREDTYIIDAIKCSNVVPKKSKQEETAYTSSHKCFQSFISNSKWQRPQQTWLQ